MAHSRRSKGPRLSPGSFTTPRRVDGSPSSQGRYSQQSRSAAREAKQVEAAARLSPVAYSNGTVFSLFGIRKDAGWLERRMVSSNCKVGLEQEREESERDDWMWYPNRCCTDEFVFLQILVSFRCPSLRRTIPALPGRTKLSGTRSIALQKPGLFGPSRWRVALFLQVVSVRKLSKRASSLLASPSLSLSRPRVLFRYCTCISV